MPKQTKIVVIVPGDFQKLLSDYVYYLQDKGIEISKSDAIIKLAQIGYQGMREEIDNSDTLPDG